jgi:hypothetical protein
MHWPGCDYCIQQSAPLPLGETLLDFRDRQFEQLERVRPGVGAVVERADRFDGINDRSTRGEVGAPDPMRPNISPSRRLR